MKIGLPHSRATRNSDRKRQSKTFHRQAITTIVALLKCKILRRLASEIRLFANVCLFFLVQSYKFLRNK